MFSPFVPLSVLLVSFLWELNWLLFLNARPLLCPIPTSAHSFSEAEEGQEEEEEEEGTEGEDGKN